MSKTRKVRNVIIYEVETASERKNERRNLPGQLDPFLMIRKTNLKYKYLALTSLNLIKIDLLTDHDPVY